MKPSIPKGTRDFLPGEVVKRKYLFDTIESIFKKYSYQPIETSAIENLSTLSGKYGEEGDRLLFKILNNGDFLKKADQAAIQAGESNKLVPSIAKRGLRYDLTVPFARFVVMHRNEIQLPFKRYQIQPVWRGDRPQKGRYQEFYQCDVDVVGSKSHVYEVEQVQIFDEVFAKLGLPVVIRLNHRGILRGIAEAHGVADKFREMAISIDKWDKIGPEQVIADMERQGITAAKAQAITSLIAADPDLDRMAEELVSSSTGSAGVKNMRSILELLTIATVQNDVRFDAKLARGLDYYTGCIFEVESPEYTAGSIGGGGRYDDLTGVFGMSGIPGVGISFGADRIYDALEENNRFPEHLTVAPKILILPLEETAFKYAFEVLNRLRRAGVTADIYPEAAKMQKQMKYANAIGCRYVGIIGEDELSSTMVALKDMQSGEQESISPDKLVEKLG